MSDPASNLVVARRYLQAIERGVTGAELEGFFAPDVVFEVLPNRLQPQGDRQDLKATLEGAERGRKAMASQIYKIMHEMADGDRVAMEVEWLGTLAVPFGSIPAGGQMKGCFCSVFGVPRG
jgi:ketosteroid isomerase-like protein